MWNNLPFYLSFSLHMEVKASRNLGYKDETNHQGCLNKNEEEDQTTIFIFQPSKCCRCTEEEEEIWNQLKRWVGSSTQRPVLPVAGFKGHFPRTEMEMRGKRGGGEPIMGGIYDDKSHWLHFFDFSPVCVLNASSNGNEGQAGEESLLWVEFD